MTDPRLESEVMAALGAIAPAIRAGAAEAERRGALDSAVATRIAEAGLYRLWIPCSAGGDELPLVPALRVFEAASRIDGSAGWAVTIGTGGGLFAGYLPAPAAAELFGPTNALVAGSGATTGRADRIEGGYRASGRWRYASGAHHATVFTANCVVYEDGQPILDEHGEPIIRAMSFPPRAVAILDTWDVSGLRATGSHDFEVAGCDVPEAHTFSVFTDHPRESGPLYSFPFQSIAELSFAAVGLGIARHALDLFTDLARAKHPGGGPASLADQPDAQRALGEAESLVHSARAQCFEIADETWDTVTAGATVDDRSQALVTLACTHAASSATRAVDLLYEVAGMDGLYMASEFGRCWRDVHALAHHALLSPAAAAEAAAALLR